MGHPGPTGCPGASGREQQEPALPLGALPGTPAPPAPRQPAMVLRESPFPSRALAALNRLAEGLLLPSFWAANRLLDLRETTAERRRRHRGGRCRCCCACAGRALAGLAGSALLLLSLPLAALGLLLWLPVQAARRPFAYQHAALPAPAAAPWAPQQRRTFTFVSANLCLLPSGLAKFSNLGQTLQRAAYAARELAPAPPSPAGARASLVPPGRGAAGGYGGTLCTPRRPGGRPRDSVVVEVPEDGGGGGSEGHGDAEYRGGIEDHRDAEYRRGIEDHRDAEHRGSIKAHRDAEHHGTIEEHRDAEHHGSIKAHRDAEHRGSIEDHRDAEYRGSIKAHRDAEYRGSIEDHRDAEYHGSIEDHRDAEYRRGIEDHRDAEYRGSIEDHRDAEHRGSIEDHRDAEYHGSMKAHRDAEYHRTIEDHRDAEYHGSIKAHRDAEYHRTIEEHRDAEHCGDTEEPGAAEERGRIEEHFPADADFLCLQEVFDPGATAVLRQRLGRSFEHVLYDVGAYGLRGRCGGFKVLNSGLLLASRYPLLAAQYRCYPNGAHEDALAAKGLLSVQVLLGSAQGQRIVGYLSCTHLQAPACDAAVRDAQLTLGLHWVQLFRDAHEERGDVVAFDVYCGDFNFDNCSRGDEQNQAHPIFEEYRDPCRIGPGRDQPWAMGTLLNYLRIYEEPVSTPEKLKRTLAQAAGRRSYLAEPILRDGRPDPAARGPWRGRRVDYVLHREPRGPAALRTEEAAVSVVTQLAARSDHLPVVLRLAVGPAPP